MQRAASLLRTAWRNQRRQPDLPRFLTYIVTFTCNARCVMCDSWRKPSPDDLGLAEIEKIFAQLPRMDAVRLSGGEPFVRRDLLDIADAAQELLDPLFLHVTTNGFLTDRIVNFCEERRRSIPLRLLISVDGMREKHDQIRGHARAWDYVVRTIETLAPRREELQLELAVNQTVVDAEGAEHYRLLRDFLRPLGVRNNLVMAYDASATYHLDDQVDLAPTEIGQFATFGDFTQEQLSDLFDEVEQDLKHYPLADRMGKSYYLKGIRNRLLHGRPAPNPKCVALSSHLRLMPDGDVPTCQFNTRTVGNLRRQSFAEVWGSESVAEQRSWVHRCPGCWAECEVLPNATYTGDLLARSLLPGTSLLHRKSPPLAAGGCAGVGKSLPVIRQVSETERTEIETGGS